MSDDIVIPFTGKTRVPITAEQILSKAPDWLDLNEDLIILGVDKDGDLAIASTTADSPKVLYALEQAKFWLMTEVNS